MQDPSRAQALRMKSASLAINAPSRTPAGIADFKMVPQATEALMTPEIKALKLQVRLITVIHITESELWKHQGRL